MEYKVIIAKAVDLEALLNTAASMEGWKIVGMAYDTPNFVVVLERGRLLEDRV